MEEAAAEDAEGEEGEEADEDDEDEDEDQDGGDDEDDEDEDEDGDDDEDDDGYDDGEAPAPLPAHIQRRWPAHHASYRGAVAERPRPVGDDEDDEDYDDSGVSRHEGGGNVHIAGKGLRSGVVPFGFAEGDFPDHAAQLADADAAAAALLARKPRAKVDAETVVSTYTNTEHHHKVLGDGVSITSARTFSKGAKMLHAGTASVAGSRVAGSAGPHAAEAADGASASASSKGFAGGAYSGGVLRLSKKTGLPLGRYKTAAAAAAAAAAEGAAAAEASAAAESGAAAAGSAASAADSGSDSDSGDDAAGDGAAAGAGGGASVSVAPHERRKGETAEERRARKAAVKEERRGARAAKKALRTAFKEETARIKARSNVASHAHDVGGTGARVVPIL